MNKTNLKRYAPQARKDFIAAVTARAQLLGLSEVAGKPYAEPCEVNGEVAVIAGRPWPASVQGKRERLLQRMKRDGYTATLEAVAYTWFNRFAALRYMELHDYLGHGRRVLSNPDGALPEILSHALELAEAGDLPGLQAEQVRQLKLDNQDGELFRRVLIAQCNALHGAMPFLFEAIDDETELLLPDNLLLSDSVVAKLVSEIPEEDWSEVEAIGWLYQFYISEKKDEVIGKVVKSEDIPAATQLFTPNWIVQYLVQNSVGRLWLMANPTSALASQWPYYIQPAEQTPEVQAQLDDLIQTRIREDGEALNPESITVLDPACGSGHILVVAYDVLKAIYLERGYQSRAIPRLILEKNLYGLDIDDRAAQLAAFALLMKARADDRRLFSDPPELNVMSLQESKGLDFEELATHLVPFGLQRAALKTLINTFEHAKTFGSLIRIPVSISNQLESMAAALKKAQQEGDLYARQGSTDIYPLVFQATLINAKYDATIANPPYMGAKSFPALMKTWLRENYKENDKDLFSAFIERISDFSKETGYYGIMTSFTWMFISSFEPLRRKIVRLETIHSLIQLHYDAFADAKAHICTFVNQSRNLPGYKSAFIRLAEFPGVDEQEVKTLEAIQNRSCGWFYDVDQSSFNVIPGSPIAYWLKNTKPFLDRKVGDDFFSGGRTKTHGNEKYLRYWWEVPSTSARWAPYATSGDFRKYYGNLLQVVDWSTEARAFYESHGGLYPKDYWGKEGITWGKITSTVVSFRFKPAAAHYDSGAGALYPPKFGCDNVLLGYLNSPVADSYLKAMNPTVNTTVNDVLALPAPKCDDPVRVSDNVARLISIAKMDWDAFERSPEFRSSPIANQGNIEVGYDSWVKTADLLMSDFQRLEEESNHLLISGSGLLGDFSPAVKLEHVTLTANASYRYGAAISPELARERFRKDSMVELISYAVGCMMGRYSLDEPGLIYAHTGNVGFDPCRYEKKFPADADGILPITDDRWFEDDAANRVREFLSSVWGVQTLDENMSWLAESLGTKGSETPEETIRRYLADKFFKDHLQTYKKRPIYWLFSSGKQGAFKALVYLHRYQAGTLARMRSEYVLPLTGKMQARMESLEFDIRQASSTAARNKLTKQLDALRKQHHELLAYDEKLRHYADQRIAIDLDDGVKVNYGMFGDLLAEVKAVTGGAGDE